ncbi:MAG: D-alanine--D-alanine ligase [Paludibacteraceae bacterium]|nr:D-alanine--D-alanine ligase [Paludibacteraceae bacterium]
MNKRIIAIVAGGGSSEHEVSLRSAAGLQSFMDKDRYETYTVVLEGTAWNVLQADGSRIPVDKNDFSFVLEGRRIRFDYAYITIHGIPGESGQLQGYFDMMHIPYSCCGVLPAAMTCNKYTCNHYLHAFGVDIAESILLRRNEPWTEEQIVSRVGLPCFIKSNTGGSSYGCTKVKTREQIAPAVSKAFAEGDEVIVEAFMKGTEVTCGVYKTRQKSVAFPLTEVVAHNEYFDYDAKYKGESDEITPARIPDEVRDKVQQLTLRIYSLLGCRGIIRTDYIILENGQINVMDINTTPGMTATSFIPQQVRAAGLDIKDVLTDIIEDSF